MLFQVVSDLHLEKTKIIPSLLKTSEVLLLAGDIGSPLLPSYREFLYQCSHQFSRVLFVAGNHEYWGSSVPETHKCLSGLAGHFKNVQYLNDSCTSIGEKVIYGSTFWSYVRKTDLKSFDNLRIKNFGFQERNRLSLRTSNAISRLRPQIVLTHYPPVRDVVHPKYAHYDLDLYTGDSPYLLSIPETWACGHLHYFSSHPKVMMNPLSNLGKLTNNSNPLLK